MSERTLRPCKACGLTFDVSTHAECPHCAGRESRSEAARETAPPRIDRRHFGTNAAGLFALAAFVVGFFGYPVLISLALGQPPALIPELERQRPAEIVGNETSLRAHEVRAISEAIELVHWKAEPQKATRRVRYVGVVRNVSRETADSVMIQGRAAGADDETLKREWSWAHPRSLAPGELGRFALTLPMDERVERVELRAGWGAPRTASLDRRSVREL